MYRSCAMCVIPTVRSDETGRVRTCVPRFRAPVLAQLARSFVHSGRGCRMAGARRPRLLVRGVRLPVRRSRLLVRRPRVPGRRLRRTAKPRAPSRSFVDACLNRPRHKVSKIKNSRETLMQWPKAKEKAKGRLEFACAAGVMVITHTTAPLQGVPQTKPCAKNVEAEATE